MKLNKILILFVLLTSLTFAQINSKTSNWNGYAQFRLYKNNNSLQGFKIRRAKLWVKGNIPNTSSFSYKVMGIFKYGKTGYFGLLDVFGSYKFGLGYLRFGQQIPEFSLQRMQPDWKIPVVERATVINRMIPAAQSFARDLGLQVHLNLLNKNWQVAAGVFNGDGANLKSHSSSNFLYTLRTSLKIDFSQNYFLHLGSSVMYRNAVNSDFSLIFGNNNSYSGDDFRFGFEALLNLNKIEIQAEYIGANFNGEKAHGYYVYANYNFTKKNQFVLSTQQLVDLNEKTIDDPWLNVGYNHLFAGHDVKLMVSGGTQFNNNYSLTTQLQIFFN